MTFEAMLRCGQLSLPMLHFSGGSLMQRISAELTPGVDARRKKFKLFSPRVYLFLPLPVQTKDNNRFEPGDGSLSGRLSRATHSFRGCYPDLDQVFSWHM